MRCINGNRLSRKGFCVCSAGVVLADFLRTETRKESNWAGRQAFSGWRDTACGTRKVDRIPAQRGESADTKKPNREGLGFESGGGLYHSVELSSITPAGWCRGTESNCRHQPFQGCALPTELPRHASVCSGVAGVDMKQVGDAPVADPTECASYQDDRSEFQFFSVQSAEKIIVRSWADLIEN